MKSWVEISQERLAANFSAVRDVVGDAVEVLAVIKANAYGHGVTVCAPVLVDAGARWLGVSDVDEGAAVRAVVSNTARVMVMCGMELGDVARIVELGLTPIVWTVEQVAAIEAAARDKSVRVSVHLEVETGMARQGAAVGAELESVLRVLAASEWVRCEGVMTHLCCSEVAGARTTRVAMESFEKAVEQVANAGVKPELVHVGNTSAVDEGSTMNWVRAKAEALGVRAMVRTGFAMYGHCLPLEGEGVGVGVLAEGVLPVMTWKTRVTGMREIESGTTVGYGASFVATKRMKLALLPIGYADGFRRSASSGIGDGWVTIDGESAMVVGRVSMNLTVVDVTGRGVSVGDDVVLLGEGVSAEDHARWAGTIAYDVLCGVRAKFVAV